MGKKIRWGILGTATIAMQEVIPALVKSRFGQVLAIASRDGEKAQRAAAQFGIKKHYGSYQTLLDDREVDAVYIPLPNHLHVKWAVSALRAGKHVLVEKPIALNAQEARSLKEEADKHPHLKVMEAFMYRFHPRWQKVRQLIEEGAIGDLKMVQSSFSFFDDDHRSIVYNRKFGGGSLMDVGCYPVSVARFLFGAEPVKIEADLDNHPEHKVDITAAGIMEFEKGRSIFFSSIQLFENQEAKCFGTQGIIELELPFNPHEDASSKIVVIKENGREEILIEPCNQYLCQVDAFSRAILQQTPLPVDLSDSILNMQALDAIKESDRLGKAVRL
ncbi:Gfo/Idh/MocA family protein [Pseudozobellia thermophila]|uniref:Predicted dehydrogenase n=1 Tax=Pseudozobellia thermophila TaxID=192903 RepID=A0A1M6I652_9FLAO|nr:Gfo/Idh/MocA family oxidoreductase [Pseudozobellia thermophila]SHJ29927.1 Predicted dehydrogenase [Pseudozobellia thermophila]